MINIKKAKREDAHAIWTIRKEAIRAQCVDYYPMESLKTWTSGALPNDFIDAVEQHFYVAIKKNLVVGMGMVNLESGKIDAIFVHPHHMRKGIGKKILNFLEDLAIDQQLQVLTLESTLNAAPFYRACGYAGDKVSIYISPRGITLECIPMVKTISHNHYADTSSPLTGLSD